MFGSLRKRSPRSRLDRLAHGCPGNSAALYPIESVAKEGERLWITLNRTALVGRVPIHRVEYSRLHTRAHLVFAKGKLDRRRKPISERSPYRGSRLGEGDDAVLLRCIAGSQLLTEKRIATRILRERFLNKTVPIWQYGPNDEVEIARIEQ